MSDDVYRWVSLNLPEGGVTITLATYRGDVTAGIMTLYCATSDIAAAHKALSDKSTKMNDVRNLFFGQHWGVRRYYSTSTCEVVGYEGTFSRLLG